MSCSTVSWPAHSAKPYARRPMAHIRAICPVHGETMGHTGIYPYRSMAGEIEGFQSPVYVGCCHLRVGYLAPEVAP